MAKNKGPGDWDWEDMDWLEEMPLDDPPAAPRRPAQQRPAQQRPTQQRPTQQRPAQQRPAQQRPAQQRSAQQRPAQQRPAQQRPAQQRPTQQRPAQQRAPQRRPAQAYYPQDDGYYDQRPPQRRQSPPPQQQSWREQGYREVAVEPDDYRPRRRGIQKQNIPLIILVVLLVGGVLFAGGKLGSMLLNYHRDRSAYNALADEATSGLAEPNATTEPGATPDPNQNQQPVSEVPFGVNWEYLQSNNSDVVGWLFCAGTNINYPVVQSTDNDYYLHRGFDKQPNTAGALFADYNSAVGVTYSNFIIYGHNMKDGSMFATVEKYLDPSYYAQHPVMYFMTPNQNYRVELIACHIVESTLNNYPGYFASDWEYQDYLNNITSHSAFATQTSVTTGYQLITMSTCDYSGSYNDPRCLLQGLLVPIT